MKRLEQKVSLRGMFMLSAIAILMVFFAASNFFAKAEGQVHNVSDFEKFKEAVEDARRGDIIVIQNIIEMDEDIILDKNLSIVGGGAGTGFKMSGYYSTFYLDSANVVFDDLEFYCKDVEADSVGFEPKMNGSGGNTLTISNCYFDEGTASIILYEDDKALSIENCVFDSTMSAGSDYELNIKEVTINSMFDINAMNSLNIYDTNINGEYSSDDDMDAQGWIEFVQGKMNIDNLQMDDSFIYIELEGEEEDGIVTDAFIKDSSIVGVINITECGDIVIEDTVFGPSELIENEECMIFCDSTNSLVIQGDSKIINCEGIEANYSNVTLKDNVEVSGNVSEEAPIYFGGSSKYTLTITDNVIIKENTGDMSGVIYNYEANVYIDKNVKINNNTSYEQAGVLCTDYGSVNISGQVEITDNSAGEYGGAIYNYGSEINISGQVKINGNSAGEYGGAINSSGGEINISGQVIMEDNEAGEYGGAIYSESDDILKIDGESILIKGNTSRSLEEGGSAIYLEGTEKSIITGIVTIEDNGLFRDEHDNEYGTAAVAYLGCEDNEISGEVIFKNNYSTSEENGGAVTVVDSTLKIKDNVAFVNNESVNGGAILIADYGDYYDVVISDDVVFDGNKATEKGGAVFLENGIFTIKDDVQFLSNAAKNGGAIYSLEEAERTRDPWWVIDNEIKINGDIIFNGNKAVESGGAIYIDKDEYEDLSINGAMFENNYADNGYLLEDTGYLAIYEAQVKNVERVSEPFTYAYNNLDIHYIEGEPLDIYTVSFELNGGQTEELIRDQHVYKDGLASRPEEEPTKQWNLFVDWMDEENGTNPWNFDENKITGNTTIYAGYKKDTTQVPVINDIYEDDKSVSGEGIPGAVIEVTFPGDKTEDCIVGEDGKWEVVIPDEVTLKEGNRVTAAQTEGEKNKSTDAETIVKGLSTPPEIDDVYVGDTEITGKGVPGSKIKVVFPGGAEVETTVTGTGESGAWRAVIPESEDLQLEDEVKATQTENNRKESTQTITYVKDITEAPEIDIVYIDNETVTGTGIPEAKIKVIFAGGAAAETNVSLEGSWDVMVPHTETLVEYEKITATQTEARKEVSSKAERIIRGISVPPDFNDVYAGADYVEGTGVPGSVIRVIFENGSEQRATVDAKSEWIVKVPDDVILSVGKEITATQTEVERKTSEEAKTKVKDISAPPTFNLVYDDDKVITGAGIPGSDIRVVFKNGAIINTTVKDDKTWSVQVPASLNLIVGDNLSALQTETGKKESVPTVTVVLSRYVSVPPVISEIYVGDETITGTGIPGAEIEVIFPDGEQEMTTVDGEGNWKVNVPDGVELKENDRVNAVQTENGKKPSEKAEEIVKARPIGPGKEKSEDPIIDIIYEGDREVTGTGVPGAEIKVTFPDGSTQTATVDEAGNWKADVPESVELKEDDRVKAVQTEEEKEPSNEVATRVRKGNDGGNPGQKDKSKNPSIDEIYEGDKEVTGKGEPGAEVEVTFPNGEKETTIVDKDGNWKVEVPDGIELEEGDKVTAIQTEKDKEPSDEVIGTVKKADDGGNPGQKEKSKNPSIDDIYEGDKEVTGKGEPGAEIEVTFPNGEKETAIVDKDGNWKVEVPDGVELEEGDKVTAIQTEKDKEPSDEVIGTVKKEDDSGTPGQKEKSKNPSIDDIYEGDKEVTGKGEPGAEVEVTFPNGEKEKAIVDKDGNWKVDVPDGVELKEGDKVTVIQTEEDKEPSNEISTTVKGKEDGGGSGQKDKSKEPTVDDIHEGDKEVTGKGEPGAEIEVTFPNGEKEKTIVDKDGNWKVKVPDGVNLKEGDKVTVIQTEEGKEPSSIVEKTVKAKRITGSGSGDGNNGNKNKGNGSKPKTSDDTNSRALAGFLGALFVLALLFIKKHKLLAKD